MDRFPTYLGKFVNRESKLCVLNGPDVFECGNNTINLVLYYCVLDSYPSAKFASIFRVTEKC